MKVGLLDGYGNGVVVKHLQGLPLTVSLVVETFWQEAQRDWLNGHSRSAQLTLWILTLQVLALFAASVLMVSLKIEFKAGAFISLLP